MRWAEDYFLAQGSPLEPPLVLKAPVRTASALAAGVEVEVAVGAELDRKAGPAGRPRTAVCDGPNPTLREHLNPDPPGLVRFARPQCFEGREHRRSLSRSRSPLLLPHLARKSQIRQADQLRV